MFVKCFPYKIVQDIDIAGSPRGNQLTQTIGNRHLKQTSWHMFLYQVINLDG